VQSIKMLIENKYRHNIRNHILIIVNSPAKTKSNGRLKQMNVIIREEIWSI